MIRVVTDTHARGFIDIRNVACGRGVFVCGRLGGWEGGGPRRPKSLGQTLDKIAILIDVNHILAPASPRLRPWASATYTRVGFVDICRVACGRGPGVQIS